MTVKLPEIVDPNFHPAPTKRVRFSDGKVITMNRKERRRNHLYGNRIVRVRNAVP